MTTDTREILRQLRINPIVRTFSLDRSAINEDARTVSVAFASDKPIEHWFGPLSLSMDTKAMRPARLRNGAPLLLNHEPKDQVGVIEDHSIGGGIARAIVRFSRSPRADEVFQDVIDGIRQNISVGFMIHEMHLETSKNGDIYRSNDWEPYEISIVAVPADISVGVGRSNKIMNNFHDTENDRPEELIRWASIFNENGFDAAGIARDLLISNPNATQEDVRVAIKPKRDAFKNSPQIPPMDPQTAAERYGVYQPAQSVRRYGKLNAFQGPDAEHRAHRFGQWVLAGPMGNRGATQWCQQNGVMLSRAAQVESINEKGGYLVPTEFGDDIVQLMERYGVFRQHAHIVPMSSDRRTDPVLNGELNSQFIGEMADGTDQDLDFGLISYTAKKQMVLVPFSSEVSEDSAISIGDTLAEAAARAFAKKEDLCGFIGDATSTYSGMIGITEALKSVDASPANIAGLQVGSGNAYSELALVDFEGVVGRLPDYGDIGNAKWFVSRKFYFSVMVKLLLSGTPTATEIEDARNRKFLGYDVVFSQVMPSTEANSQVCAIFGDLSQGSRLADRRTFTIAIDESLLFRKDALLFRATSRFDINNSFGVGDTTNAGPIVGLITAAS